MTFELSHLGVALGTVVLALFLARRRGGRRSRILLPVFGVALVFAPLVPIPLAGYVRGIAGELSVTTMVLLVVAALVLVGGPDLRRRGELTATLGVVLAFALFLYPLALGLSPFDPYALGFDGRAQRLLVALALVALVAWLLSRWLLLACVVSAVAAHYLDLGESQNLWDYWIDPWVSLYALGFFVRKALLSAGFTIFGQPSKSR